MQTKIIQSKMKSVQNIKKITKTMEMVSISKMKRATAKALAGKSYAEKAYGLIASIGTDMTERSDLCSERIEGKNLCIVVASDKGLCGGYNAIVYRELMHIDKNTDIIAIGRYAQKSATRSGLQIIESFSSLPEQLSVVDIDSISKLVMKKFTVSKEYKQVYILSVKIVRGISYQAEKHILLPLALVEANTQQYQFQEYTYEPDKKSIIESLVPGLIQSLLLQHIREARAAEHTARMVAMKSATDNANTYYNQLKLSFNRARQSGITAEIAEIVAGANALSE
jgi:F-type H+-transporting ATPase subunit gamma